MAAVISDGQLTLDLPRHIAIEVQCTELGLARAAQIQYYSRGDLVSRPAPPVVFVGLCNLYYVDAIPRARCVLDTARWSGLLDEQNPCKSIVDVPEVCTRDTSLIVPALVRYLSRHDLRLARDTYSSR